MLNEVHTPSDRAMPIRDIIARMRHDGCGGRAGRAELLTGIEAASSRPVRRIVLNTNPMLQPSSPSALTKEKPPPGVGGSGGGVSWAFFGCRLRGRRWRRAESTTAGQGPA